MKFTKYLKDKLYAFLLFGICLSIVVLLFFAFKISAELIFATASVLIICFVLALSIDYARRFRFYRDLFQHIDSLDQAYLVLETLLRPDFYEGALIYEALHSIDKSMHENVSIARQSARDFQEYIELWVHEIKAPLAALMLIAEHRTDADDIRTELSRIENYLDQVLYYTRSENANKDYLIRRTSLAKVVRAVSLKQMNALLASHVDLTTENLSYEVLTDAKWLEFILSQIIQNSIKYRRKIKHSTIKISARRTGQKLSSLLPTMASAFSPQICRKFSINLSLASTAAKLATLRAWVSTSRVKCVRSLVIKSALLLNLAREQPSRLASSTRTFIKLHPPTLQNCKVE